MTEPQLNSVRGVIEAGQAQQQIRDVKTRALFTSLTAHIRRLTWMVGALSIALLVQGALIAWFIWHQPKVDPAMALGVIDATIGRQWTAMPRQMQEAFSETYRGVGLTPPPQRQ